MSQQAKGSVAPTAGTPVPRFQSLDESSQRTLQVLLRSYPDPISINALVEPFNLGFPIVEWIAENLEKHERIQLIPRDRRRDNKIILTKIGRNYCMDITAG